MSNAWKKRTPPNELHLLGGPLDGEVLHFIPETPTGALADAVSQIAGSPEPVADYPVEWYRKIEDVWHQYSQYWGMVEENGRKYAEPRLKYVGTVNEQDVPDEYLEESEDV